MDVVAKMNIEIEKKNFNWKLKHRLKSFYTYVFNAFFDMTHGKLRTFSEEAHPFFSTEGIKIKGGKNLWESGIPLKGQLELTACLHSYLMKADICLFEHVFRAWSLIRYFECTPTMKVIGFHCIWSCLRLVACFFFLQNFLIFQHRSFFTNTGIKQEMDYVF